jgi:serine/threonine protein kinase
MDSKETTDLIGKIFDNRYQIKELIGRGGMGAVYKAVHTTMNQVVAVKVLNKEYTGDEKQVQRFYQEARNSSQLKHPNTIRVFDFGRSEDGHLYIAMEYLEGTTLTKVIQKDKTIPIPRIVNIIKQALKALGEAHAIGLIHRDLKPDNIFLTKIYGEDDFVKVLDFGIAKFYEGSQKHESLTQTGFICGTPLYISPEQALGRELDHRADLYSIGVILYEMVCGKPPFKADNPLGIVMKHIHDTPPPLSTHVPDLYVPLKMNAFIFRLLDKNRNNRPSSSDEAIQELDSVLFEMKESGIIDTASVRAASISRPKMTKQTSRLKPETAPAAEEDKEDTLNLAKTESKPAADDHDKATAFLDSENIYGSDAVPELPPELKTDSSQKLQQAKITGSRKLKMTGPVKTMVMEEGDIEAGEKPAVRMQDVHGTPISHTTLTVATRSLPMIIFAILFSVVSAGLVSYLVIKYAIGNKSEQAAETAPAATQSVQTGDSKHLEDSSKKEVHKPAAFTITIRTTPDSAWILLDGKKFGQTPFAIELSENDSAKAYSLEKEGFKKIDVQIDPKSLLLSRQRNFSFVLEKIEATAEKKTDEKETKQEIKKEEKKIAKPKKTKLKWEDF